MGKVNEFQNLIEKTVDSSEVFAGEMLHVYRDNIELPNGKIATREYVKHVGAVAVVALTENGSVVMEKQYRYPARRVVTEIPAGKLNSLEEDRLAAAKRELREETGIEADEWVELGEYHPASAYCNEKIWMFMARGLRKGEQDLDEDEFLNVVEVPLEELVEQVLDGTIKDGKTQVALLKAAVRVGVLKA